VDVLAEDAELREEIDLEKARRRKEEAENRLRDPGDARAAADLAKAVTRIDLAG
jgi:F0F1-type ATP synthase epsilon subunit